MATRAVKTRRRKALKESRARWEAKAAKMFSMHPASKELCWMTPWQRLLLVLRSPAFGCCFDAERIAEITDAPMDNVKATLGSVKMIGVAGVVAR